MLTQKSEVGRKYAVDVGAWTELVTVNDVDVALATETLTILNGDEGVPVAVEEVPVEELATVKLLFVVTPAIV